MKAPSRLIILLACLCSALLTSACRTPPPSSPPMPQGPAQETTTPTAPPSESSETNNPPPPSQTAQSKPAIERSLPESQIAAPVKDLVSRNIDYGTSITSRAVHPQHDRGWQYRRTRQGQIVGFEFANHGGNSILAPRRDATKNQFFSRDFQFRFDDRARQDIHLMISDWVPSQDRVFRLSELMNSLIHFFPRTYLPAIANAGERNIVTLPTGEEVEFNAITKEIRGGVLMESAVDLNPDRKLRRYPAIDYLGKGVMVRADARGADPRLGTKATISTATPTSNCDRADGCRQCEVPSAELWEQSGAVRFKFHSDEEFDRYLTIRCNFGLPRFNNQFAVALPPSR